MSKERISWENEYPDELEREGRMGGRRPRRARSEAAGNAVDEAVAEAVWADGEGEAAAMDVVDDAPAMGAVDEAAVAEAVGEGGRVKSGRPRETQQQKLARIKRELEAVPTEPGVYLWKDAAGEVIYVGKAKHLRARMRQYVISGRSRKDSLARGGHRLLRLPRRRQRAQALVLEKNLINQYSPFSTRTSRTTRATPSSRSPKAMCSRPSSTTKLIRHEVLRSFH
ncbi:MAG: GIY-YIG nuclease family protein [Coriobacteriaceae bacterium]